MRGEKISKLSSDYQVHSNQIGKWKGLAPEIGGISLENMSNNIQKFAVSLKAFIIKGGKPLVLKERKKENFWELPGGRVGESEIDFPPTDVLIREVKEELRDDIEIEIGQPVAAWIRIIAGGEVFLVGYLCHYKKGEIKLSGEHEDYAWVDEYSIKKLEFNRTFESVLSSFWKKYSFQKNNLF